MERGNPVNREQSILGIHINDDYLHMVHMGRTSSGLEVYNQSTERLEASIIKDGLIVDTGIISQTIHNFVRTSPEKPHQAIISLLCSALRLKPCEFTTQRETELKTQVQDQIQKYSLFEGREVVFDYCVFKDKTQYSSKQMVLQAFTTRQISDSCLEAVKRAKLDLVRIEPVVLPIIKLVFNKSTEDLEGISLLLAIDTNSANICVFQNGVPLFCQNLNVSVKELPKDEDRIRDLVEQMKYVLEFARSLSGSQQLVLRTATASNSVIPMAVVELIRQNLSGVIVEYIDPLQITKKYDVHGDNGQDLPFFAFASALSALRDSEPDCQLNLVSQQSLTIQKTQRQMSLTAAGIVAVVLLSIAALVPLKMKIKGVEAASAEIEAKLTESTPIREKIAYLKNQIKQLKEKESAYDVVSEKLTSIPWHKILQIIGDAVPNQVRIVYISTTEAADFTLIGEALAENRIYTFAQKLQDSEFIESANVEEIEYDNSTANVVDYKITCQIQVPKGNL
jgi:Tfp pilus assembly PilM family ATPase/Tfp pilus assembly protein PilN